ncbi:MAG: hypothetical protein IMZ53_15660 [Thermoplasmata archaeon]|nr:hypothetical protein [Thermoplasmata archaeon]MBE3142010.1 hypothetical protein [Thermoplasmata archaeon]
MEKIKTEKEKSKKSDKISKEKKIKKQETKLKKQTGTLLDAYTCEKKKVKLSEIIVDYVKPDAGLKESRGMLGETNDVTLNELPNLDSGKKYHVIDGRKRINDSIQEGRLEIEAKVFKNLPVGIANFITLVQNLQRSTSPVIEAEAIQEEINKGKTLKEISEITGISPSVLGQRLSLLKLPKTILEKLRRNEIKYSVAKRIASLPLDVQNKISKEEKIIGEVVEKHHRAFLNSQTSFDDMDLPKKVKGTAIIRNYHVKCGHVEKDATRKELLSLLEDMLPELTTKDEIVIKRLSN